MHRWMDRWLNGQTGRQVGRWMDELTYHWIMDGKWMERMMDRQIDELTDNRIKTY